MKKILALICLSLVVAGLASCEKEVEKLVEVERIVKDTVYVNTIKKDTIYIDKIVRDTIVNNIHDTLYVDKIVKDTLYLSSNPGTYPSSFKSWLKINRSLYDQWLIDGLKPKRYYNDQKSREDVFGIRSILVFYGKADYAYSFLQKDMLILVGIADDGCLGYFYYYDIENNVQSNNYSVITYKPLDYVGGGSVVINSRFFTNTYIEYINR